MGVGETERGWEKERDGENGRSRGRENGRSREIIRINRKVFKMKEK